MENEERNQNPCGNCNGSLSRRIIKKRRLDDPDNNMEQQNPCTCPSPSSSGSSGTARLNVGSSGLILPPRFAGGDDSSDEESQNEGNPIPIVSIAAPTLIFSPPNHHRNHPPIVGVGQPQPGNNVDLEGEPIAMALEINEESGAETVEIAVNVADAATLPIPAPSPGPGPGPRTPSFSFTGSSNANVLSRVDELGWQESRPTLTQRAGYLLNNSRMSDVRFLVGESKQEVFGHKTILALGSPVFEAQFFGGVGHGAVDVIELPDLETETFMLFLKYLYMDELDENLDDAQLLNLLRPAKKYIVPHLVDKCSDILMTELRPENIFQILHHAQFFQLRKLEGACERYIDRNSEAIVISEEFTNLSKPILTDFLKRDGLNIREESLFQAVIRWASAECQRNSIEANFQNLRDVLGDCLKLIRFPTMDKEEFATAFENTSILSAEEACSIFVFLCKSPPNPLGNLVFPTTKRCFAPRMHVVSRFGGQPDEHSLNYRSGEIYNYRVNFKADRHVFFKGVNIFSIRCGTSGYHPPGRAREFSGALYLYEKNTSIQEGRKQFTKSGSLEPDETSVMEINGGRRQYYPVLLDSEIPLQPGKLYTVCVVVSVNCHNYPTQPLQTYVGTSERRGNSVVFLDDSLTINFTFPGSSVDGSVGRFTCAQIPEIIFCL